MEPPLDRRKIDRVVLDAWVVTLHEQRTGAQHCQQDEIFVLAADSQCLFEPLRDRMDSRKLSPPFPAERGEKANLCDTITDPPAPEFIIPALSEAARSRARSAALLMKRL
jgi:hypothetical protein